MDLFSSLKQFFSGKYVRAKVFVILAPLLLAFWMLVIAPRLTKLPSDFSYQADLISYDNFYDHAANAFLGPQRSASKFSYETVDVRDGVQLIKNSFDVHTTNGVPIFSTNRLYGIDPVTRAQVPGYGDEARNGFLFAPLNVGTQPYLYWHVNYDAPAQMIFQGSEVVYGVKVNHYQAAYHADQTKDLQNLPGVGKTRGVNLDIRLDVWIEPVSGWLVNYADVTEAYFYDLHTGKRIEPWNNFSNSYTEDSLAKQAGLAAAEKEKILFMRWVFPAFLLLLVLLRLGRRSLLFRKESGYIHPVLTSLLVAIVGILMAVAVFIVMRNNTQNELALQFRNSVTEMTALLQGRMDIYSNALYGAQGLFAASQSVEENEWLSYFRQIDLASKYPGISAMSFVRRAPGETYPITYIASINGVAPTSFGIDLSKEPVRWAALTRARDTGTLVTTGVVPSLTTANLPVFSIYGPIYKNGASVHTVTERRAALVGFAGAGFRVTDLFTTIVSHPVFDKNIDVEIYDAPTFPLATSDNLIFDTDRHANNGSMEGPLVQNSTIVVPGRTWIAHFTALPSYQPSFIVRAAPYGVLAVGIILSSLFGLLMYSYSAARARAVGIAEGMTKELQESRATLQNYIDQMSTFNAKIDLSGKYLLFNKPVLTATGMTAEEVLRTNFFDGPWWDSGPGVRARIRKAFERAVKTKQTVVTDEKVKLREGDVRYLDLSFAPVVDKNGAVEYIVAEGRDITPLKAAEAELQKRTDELEQANKLMVGRELKMIELKEEIAREKGNA